jgi:hypothetical protein
MIKSVLDRKDHTVMFQAMGRLTFPEIHAAVVAFALNTPASKVLCDLTQGTASHLTSLEIESILESIGRQLEGTRGGKAAIVVPAGVDNGLARLFGTFAEIANLPVEVKVFRTPEVARQWLQEV